MKDQYVAAFKQLAPALPGSAWLATQRHQAIEQFNRLGFPTIRDEHWKYTRLHSLEQDFFHTVNASQQAAELPLVNPWLMPTGSAHRLVFIDGHYAPAFSQILPVLSAGVQLLNLKTALQNPALQLELLVGKTANSKQTHFNALNTAFMTDGAYIDIPAGITIAEPIELVFINTQPHCCASLRNIINLGNNANANIIEHYINQNPAKNFTNKITEIFLAGHAVLNHVLVQQESAASIHIGAVNVEQQAHSQFNSWATTFGGNLIRNNIQVDLMAAYARCALNGLYLAADKQHIDFHTQINHIALHCTSRELYKGIITDRARGVFNGKIQVFPQAQKTDAQLTNQNLLLSRHAEIDTKPELEIYADDVKCSHGATVGQLDETSLFYLRSRGIKQEDAKSILTYAFAEEVIQHIPQPALQQSLHKQLIQHLFSDSTLTELL